MRALLPLVVLTLAACDPPLEELFPPRFYTFERGGIAYDARAQFDPIERGWFVRVTSIERPLTAGDGELALAIAERDLGPLVCEGNALGVEPGEVWNPLAGDQVMFLAGPGTWQFVGRCTDAPPAPAVLAVFPPEPIDRTVVAVFPGGTVDAAVVGASPRLTVVPGGGWGAAE